MKPIEIVSPDFLLLTLVTAVVYYILSPRAQVVWLLAVSFFFLASLAILLSPLG